MNIQLSDHFTYGKLIRFTLPSVAMMIFTSIYGMVDGFFVSNYAGKTAFAAVNMIWPVLMILATVGLIFGTGGTAIVAKTMGEGDREKADRYFSLFTYVTFGLGLVFAVLGIIFMRPLAMLLGAEGQLLHDCIVYGRINGSSEFMSNVSMNLVGILYNLQLLKYAGEDGVAAYGVMMYVSFVFSATFIGYSIGIAPVIGFNYGAENHKELKGLLRKSLIITGILGVMMVIIAEGFATPLSKIFVGYDPALLELTVSGFRTFAWSFIFMGFAIFGSGFFTALNDGVTSAIISFLRTMVFQCAAVMLLLRLLGIDGIWYSIIVAEFMAVVLTTFFIIRKRNVFHYL